MPTTTITRATIERPNVPPTDQMVRPRDWDGTIVHDIAVLHLPGGATARVTRHVSADDVIFTGHIDGAPDLAWIDDDDRADTFAECAEFVARELRAARVEYARSRGGAIQRHPAGSAR